MALAINDKDGKKYIKGKGKFYYLSKDRNGALDDVPEGYQLVKINDRLFIKKKS